MVSSGTKSNQIVLMSDVVLLGVVQWVVVRDVVLDAAILLVRWTVDCQQLLRGFEDGGLAPRSVHVPRDSSLAWTVLTVRIESMFDFFEQSLPWHELVGAQIPSVACSNMFSVIFVKPPLQDTQDILFFEEKTALKVSEAAVYGEGVTAVFECG